MPKSVCKLVIILNILIFSFSANSQDVEEIVQVNDDIVAEKIIKNEFEQLVSVESIVYQLRKKFGIRGSVILSKSLWQILTSFSDQQQAQSIWQTAMNTVAEIDKSTYPPHINLEFSSLQVMSEYTNGMNLEKWDDNKLLIKLTRKNIEDSFVLNDDLTNYMHMEEIWEIILADIIKQESIMWNDVFLDSINLFVDSGEQDVVSSENPGKDVDLINALITWQNQENLNNQLADLVETIENVDSIHNPLYQSIIRFSLNKHHNYYLAASLSWLEVAYRLSVIKENLTEVEKSQVDDYIEQIDLWFLSNEQQLIAVNSKMHEWTQQSINNLKSLYRDENQDQNSSFTSPNVYKIVESGFHKYMATPFRQEIRKNLEICLNISEEFAPYPQIPITVNQFKGCIDDFTNAATIDAKTHGLSGFLTKLETINAFDRALELPAWQSINILYGNEASNDCIQDSQTLANPFEWSLAAESLLWFVDRWPGYSAIYPEANDFMKIINEGEKLINQMPCLPKPKSEILTAQLNQIVLSWQNVKTQIKQVANEFNQNNLSKGSDIDLLTGSDKPSNYRVEEAVINACDDQMSCGVHVELDSSRALFGLYPNHLLIADQLKLGQLKLCYDNVGWENRRSASTHLDNDSVANYFGHFSFSIKGFYNEELIFERKISSKLEYNYLFGANTEEVLSTYCPLSIVGSNISTSLKQGTYGLVPNRLTFLTASRANESNIMASNWSDGEEWKDLITTEQATVVSENLLEELSANSQLAYQQKAKELQDLIYMTLLNRNPSPTVAQKSLIDAFASMHRMTKVFSHLLYIIETDELLSNDELHGMLYGMDQIPNMAQFDKYYQNQLNINQLIERVDENIKNNQIKWNNFSSYWSHAYLKNILYRLKSKI